MPPFLGCQIYTQIPASVFNATSHWEFNLEATIQGLVLLRNWNETLPLRQGEPGCTAFLF